MKRATKFLVSPTWKVLLSDMNIDVQAVLAHAGLPADLFIREQATLSPNEYFQLWHGFEKASKGKELPLLFAKCLSVESFDAPLFASICSPNLNVAFKRLSQYKPLIGPMMSEVTITESFTEIAIHCYGHKGELPRCLGLSEVVFMTQLARLATREALSPVSVEVQSLPEDISQYEHYFGCPITQGDCVKIRFRSQDASKPFLTSNAQMWSFFESKLNQKLADLDTQATTQERVRSVLIEALPSGENSIESVAERLAMSKRTLQRKLSAENVSFQGLLQDIRAELADHYLAKSELTLGEISFLLGFQESNSFIRAYSGWKGFSPGAYREQYLH